MVSIERSLHRGSSEYSPREIAARGVHKALTEKIISQGNSPCSCAGRFVVRGKAFMPVSTIEEAIEGLRQGRMIVLLDDKNRENEGDLCMAAEKVTPEAINFMARYGRGLICLPMTEERVEQLGLTMMVSDNTSPFGTAFTVTIDGVENVTTGISASDRAVTILAPSNSLLFDLKGENAKVKSPCLSQPLKRP